MFMVHTHTYIWLRDVSSTEIHNNFLQTTPERRLCVAVRGQNYLCDTCVTEQQFLLCSLFYTCSATYLNASMHLVDWANSSATICYILHCDLITQVSNSRPTRQNRHTSSFYVAHDCILAFYIIKLLNWWVWRRSDEAWAAILCYLTERLV